MKPNCIEGGTLALSTVHLYEGNILALSTCVSIVSLVAKTKKEVKELKRKRAQKK